MDKALETALAQQMKEFRDLIDSYCRLESVAAQNRMMGKTADWVENLLKETGFVTLQLEVEDAPNYVYAELKGRSDFTLLLYNHYDVQPEDPIDLWESPPFELTERDGKLYARGIADDKADLIARVCAIRALLSANGELPITIKWIIEGEEEIGSIHFDAMTKAYGDLFDADGIIWEGLGFHEKGGGYLALGFRGVLGVEYSVEAMKQDAHSGNASFLPSAAWRLVKALSSLRDENGRVLIPGFYDDVREPTEKQKEVLRRQVDPEMEKLWKEMFGIKAFNDGASGYENLVQVFKPTSNIAGFLTGYTGEGAKGILPAKAMAKMDFRLVPDQTPDDILEKLKAHLKSQGFDDIKVKKLGGAEPVVVPMEDEFAQKIDQICVDFTGQETYIDVLNAGTLPLLEAFKKNLGLFGVSTATNPSYYGSGIHSPNEHIRLDDVARAIEFCVYLFERLGE